MIGFGVRSRVGLDRVERTKGSPSGVTATGWLRTG